MQFVNVCVSAAHLLGGGWLGRHCSVLYMVFLVTKNPHLL